MHCDNCGRKVTSWNARYGGIDSVFCKKCFKTPQAEKIIANNLNQQPEIISRISASSDDFFSTQGRIRRSAYFIRTILLTLPIFLFGIIAQNSNEPGIVLILAFFSIGLGILQIIQAIKRLHDIELGGEYVLLGLVPIVNFAFGLYLIFKDGTIGPNVYGEDPKKKERILNNGSKSSSSLIKNIIEKGSHSLKIRSTQNFGLDDLEKLSDLKNKGIITEDEFSAKKKQILDL